MKNNRFVVLVLAPTMALLALFFITPIVGSFVIAMFDYNALRTQNPFLGLGNYARLLTDTQFKEAFVNTLVFVFVTVALNLVLALLIAQLMSQVRRRWLRNLLLVMIFLPCVAPLANSAVVWHRSMFPTKDGLLNMMITALGGSSINWIGDPKFQLLSIILITLWADLGYNTVLFGAGMDGIPSDFYEAADIDGAGVLMKFFRITLPLLARTFSFVAAMTLISHFQMFVQFQIIGKPQMAMSTYIYHVGFKIKDMGFASSVSVVLFLVILVVTLFQQRLNKVDWGY